MTDFNFRGTVGWMVSKFFRYSGIFEFLSAQGGLPELLRRKVVGYSEVILICRRLPPTTYILLIDEFHSAF